MTWSSNDTSVSDKEFFDLITWKVDEIFSEIYIRYKNNSDLFRPAKLDKATYRGVSGFSKRTLMGPPTPN